MGLASTDQFTAQPFDYIVIGVGTAGLVIAVRLSEDENIKVGVIEAGSAHLHEPQILNLDYVGPTLYNPEYNWGLTSVPQV
jgi:choline dehydrogenase-like flavoprotein